MQVSGEHKKITVLSPQNSSVAYIHQLVNMNDGSCVVNKTFYKSEFTVEEDGYFIVKEYVISRLDERDPLDIVANNTANEAVDLLVLCFMEDELGKYNKLILNEMMYNNCICNKPDLLNIRDFLLTSFSTLKYLGELSRFQEAQRLITKFKKYKYLCRW